MFAECLAVGLACGDQHQLTGSGSTLEVLRDDAPYKSTHFTFMCRDGDEKNSSLYGSQLHLVSADFSDLPDTHTKVNMFLLALGKRIVSSVVVNCRVLLDGSYTSFSAEVRHFAVPAVLTFSLGDVCRT